MISEQIDEIREIVHWFDVYYTIHEQKYQRMLRLNDTTENWADKLQQLDEEAEIKRARIQELEVLLQEQEQIQDNNS